MKQSQLNHLRRLLGWVRCEIIQSPDELVEIAKVIAQAGVEIGDSGKEALVKMHDQARSVPKYVRAAEKALSAMIAGRGEVAETTDAHALLRIKKLVDMGGQDGWKDERTTDVSRGRILAIVDEAIYPSVKADVSALGETDDLPCSDDPRVRFVYGLIAMPHDPPAGESWEMWAARNIVAGLNSEATGVQPSESGEPTKLVPSELPGKEGLYLDECGRYYQVVAPAVAQEAGLTDEQREFAGGVPSATPPTEAANPGRTQNEGADNNEH